jgi:threonine dehydrogenase-like Zn-dependent dehydrogenase
VTGLGPVGLAVGLLARALGAWAIVGLDVVPERAALARELGAVDAVVPPGDDAAAALRDVGAADGADVAVDCSGSAGGREAALAGTRRWGRVVLVGEGGRLEVDASPALIHRQLTVHGSWVTSVGRMEELTRLLVHWDLHPERVVTDRFRLEDADAAYRLADGGLSGKVAVVMDE